MDGFLIRAAYGSMDSFLESSFGQNVTTFLAKTYGIDLCGRKTLEKKKQKTPIHQSF